MAVTCNSQDPNQVVVYTIEYQTTPCPWGEHHYPTSDTTASWNYIKSAVFIDRDRSGSAPAEGIAGTTPKVLQVVSQALSQKDEFITYSNGQRGGGFIAGNVLDCSLPQYQVGPLKGQCEKAKDAFIQIIAISTPVRATVRCEAADYQAPERLAQAETQTTPQADHVTASSK